MRPKIRTVSLGARRLNTALGIVELAAALVLFIIVVDGLLQGNAAAGTMIGGVLFAIYLIGAGITHIVFSVRAADGTLETGLTNLSLGLGFVNIPWGTAVAFYTWMRLDDPDSSTR